jgi:hypothetical protein
MNGMVDIDTVHDGQAWRNSVCPFACLSRAPHFAVISCRKLIVQREDLLKELYCMEQAMATDSVTDMLHFDPTKAEPRDSTRFKEYLRTQYPLWFVR